MENVNIISSDKKVISSGSFIAFDKNQSKISLNYNNENFDFIFKFIENESKKPSLNYHPNDDKSAMIIEFYNFNNQLPIGLVKPISVLNLDNIKIYLQVLISSVNSIKKITFTFYEGKNE